MRTFIGYRRIANAAKHNAQLIDKYYHNDPEPIVLLAVLGGSVMWLSEIMKHLKHDCYVDFVKVSSYTDNKQTKLKWQLKPQLDLTNRHVVIIEDIVDTGATIREISTHLYNKCQVKSTTVCTMLARQGVFIEPEFLGYVIDNEAYVVGFGLDDNQLKRNSENISIL